jgi:UDP-N-acetylmuramoylalanine--D-glutamate ligase
MAGERALVVGLGLTGRAAALALAARAWTVRATDRRADADAGRLAEAGVEVLLGTEEEDLLQDVDVVVKSPGVPGEAPLIAAARARDLPVWSELELGWRLLAGNPIVGVTGTKGKTTTVRLLAAMFDAAARSAVLAGNEHTPLSEVALSIEPGTWIVCEVSSFALEDVHEFRCDVAVLLNLEPDHLDRHSDFESYRAAKLRIFERAETKIVPTGSGLDGIEFGADDPLPAEPLLPGRHNRANAAAAAAAARAAGLEDAAIVQALETFAGVPHRLETVRELHGVRYVNDSKATNVAAAVRALETFAGDPVHVILGGSSKGEDFTPVAAAIGPNVRSVHLVGVEAARIGEVVEGHVDGTLERALAHAGSLAQPGEIVLLAPACASYDQFRNFEERGEAFRRLVEALQ